MFLINPYTFVTASGDNDFKITVDTTVTAGGSASDTFILPLQNGATNMTVYWGDGNSDVITTYNQAELTHVYASSGTYQITLDGSFYGIRFAGTGDCRKLSSIDNWGNNQWGSMANAFQNCRNVVGNYTDNPDTSLVTTMNTAFRDCKVFNSPLDIDTSNVTDMNNIFISSSLFNQDISGWDISSLTTASLALQFTAFSTTNYDLLLVAWEGQTELTGVAFHAGTAKYSAGAPATARGVLVGTSTWTITDGGPV